MSGFSGLKPRHKRLLLLIKENRWRLYLAMVCMMVVAATSPASAYLIKPALDDIFVSKDIIALRLVPLAVIVVFFLRGIGMYGQAYFMSYVGEGIIRNLRDLLYSRISDLPLSFYHQEKTGTLMSRVTNDVNIIKIMVSDAVAGSVRDFFTIIFLTGLIFFLHWKLALVAFFVLPLAFYPIVVFGRKVRRVSTFWQEAMADISVFLHETIAGSKIVKAFGMEAYEKERFFEKNRRLFRIEMKAVIARSLSSPVMEFFGGIGIAFVIWFGGSQVISGRLTVGTFIAFISAVIMLYDPVKKISRLNNAIQEGLAATDRVFDVIERESEIQDPPIPIRLEHKPHQVVFEQVGFKYESHLVLRDINLEVKPGEILALVGMSGGGKSTLVNLLPRFYDVCEGRILIDGIDIRDITLQNLRRQIAVVTQEPILFNDTVRNNIAYGKPDADEAEIRSAAQAAYALDFIQGFPKGFETNIGELGNRLSGGERQRICIARALLKNAPILILDEATSALDTEAEMLVQKALENLMTGRTTFVIAHRLSTISKADRIIVIVNGRIVEQGKHAELLAAGGEYYKLYQMQFVQTAGDKMQT
ncbi:MAG: lipid A export permease/ATP-binding protein MsbA [Thermodesulfobacteriota bacterium]